MQSITGWPAPSPVRVPTAAVQVAGGERGIVSASVDASVKGTSVSARTGRVAWAPADPVARRQMTPLNGAAPRRGDRVSLDAGQGGAVARLLTGKVETTTAQVPGGLVSDVVDDWDLLARKVSIPPLAATMFPREPGGALRSVGLTATAITQRVLSLCGFHATPPPVIGTMLSASLNGTLWPENGVLQNSQTMPTFTPAPWGEAARGFTASYNGGVRSFSDGALEISFVVSPESAAAGSWVAATWAGGFIRLSVASGSAAAQFSTGTTTNVLALSSAELAGALLLRLRVGSGGAWRLTTDTGVEKVGSQSIPSGFLASPASWDVYVPSNGRIIGGVNAGFPNSAGPTTFTPTARLDPGDGTLAASRAIVERRAVDVLRERADAEHAHMWIDGAGVFQWRDRTRWGAGAPVVTLTDVDLLGYEVGMDYDSLYSGATVECVTPRVEMRRQPTVSLHQSTKQTLSGGDIERNFIEVPADEEWYAMDTFVGVLGGDAQTGNFNKGLRSFNSAIRVGTDGSTELFAYGQWTEYVTFELETLSTRKWLHTTTVAGNLPADQTIETRAPDLSKMAGTGIWSQWNTYATPVLRGHGRAVWVEESRTGGATTDARLPVLEHDAGWWLSLPAVQRLANWLSMRYTTPVVTLRGVEIVPDERLEIGDVIALSDSTYADLSARVVITGIHYQTSNGAASMSIDVEVLEVTSTRRTYATVQAEASWRTYAQFQALVGAVTYSEQEAG